MNSLLVQHSYTEQSPSRYKYFNPPNTSTSFNTLSHIPPNNNPQSQQQLHSVQLSAPIQSQSNKSKEPSFFQQSPKVSPFSVEGLIRQSAGNKSAKTATFNQQQNSNNKDPEVQDSNNKDSETGWGHSLIKFIIQRSANRTIQHQINIIPSNIILHRQYPSTQPNSIQEAQTALVSGKKLNQVYYKIKNEFINLQRIKNQSEQHHVAKARVKSAKSLAVGQNNPQNQNQSFIQGRSGASLHRSCSEIKKKTRTKTQPNNKMIIPSALVTYRFKSLKAQNSLVRNPLKNKSSQQLLQSQLKSIKDRLNCASHRGHKIEYRSVGKKLKQTKHKQIAFREGLIKKELKDVSTSQYLKQVLEEKGKIDKIYGQEGSRLQYISYLMNELSLERPLAQESVEMIDQMIREELRVSNGGTKTQMKEEKRYNMESEEKQDEIMLSQRKKMVYKVKRTKKLHEHKQTAQNLSHRSGLILKQLTFLNQY